MVPFSLLPLAPGDQASNLRKWATATAGEVPDTSRTSRVLVTGALPPQRITFWTLLLGKVAAENGHSVLICHPAPARKGEFSQSLPVRKVSGSAESLASGQCKHNYLELPGQLELLALVPGLSQDSGTEPPNAGPGEPARNHSICEKPKILKVLPNLSEAVVPSEQLGRWLNCRECHQARLTLIDGDPTQAQWLRWWKHVDAVLLILGDSQETLIQNYAFMKAFRHYPPTILVAVQAPRASTGRRIFQLLSGASRRFLGTEVHYLGLLPQLGDDTEQTPSVRSAERNEAVSAQLATLVCRILSRLSTHAKTCWRS